MKSLNRSTSIKFNNRKIMKSLNSSTSIKVDNRVNRNNKIISKNCQESIHFTLAFGALHANGSNVIVATKLRYSTPVPSQVHSG